MQILDYFKGTALERHLSTYLHCVFSVKRAKEVYAQPQIKTYAEVVTTEKSLLKIVLNMIMQFISYLNSIIGPLISLSTEI